MRKLLAFSLLAAFNVEPSFAQMQLGPQVAPPSTVQPNPARPRPTAKPAAPKPVDQSKQEILPPQSDEVVIVPPKVKISNPTAIFSGLDKITGRIITFDVAINETVQFGALQITPRVCYTRPPTEAPQTTSFVDVNEKTLQGDLRKVFTGWMFAASPGLSGVEHAVYDIWLSNCKNASPYIPARAAAPASPTPASTAAPNPTAPPVGQTPLRR